MGQRAADLIGAGLLVALGAAFAIGALTGLQILGEEGRIGPGFMPFFTGLLLAVFGVLVGLETLLRGPREQDEENPQDAEGEDGSRRTVALVFGLTLVAIVLIPVLGFLVAFGLLVFGLIWFVEREGLLLGAGLGVGAAVLAWLVFGLFLQIPLPGGVFGLGG